MHQHWTRPTFSLAAVLLAALALLVAAASASANVPPPLAQVPEDGKPGAEAGRMSIPRGIAADRSLPGDVYVVDGENERIDQFTAWGEFVRAWGWGVVDGAATFESCTTQTGCREGLRGSGVGEFNEPEAVTVDGAGNVYVIEAANHRVQKFDTEGNFLAAFGSAGTGPGQLGGGFPAYINEIAASPVTGSVFVAEGGRIQRFSSSGAFEGEIEGGCLAGKTVNGLAVDTVGDLYVSLAGEARVLKLKGNGPTAECVAPTFAPENTTAFAKALALDGSGNLYVLLPPIPEPEPERAQEYDASGECLTCSTKGEEEEVRNEKGELVKVQKPGFDRTHASQLRSIAANSACGADDVYITHAPTQSFLKVFGAHPDPALCPPPRVPPLIKAQYAVGVETGTATLQADINPRFWSGNVGETTYYVQYGTADCVEGGWAQSCVKDQPLAPGVRLAGGAVNEAVHTAPVLIEGLASATAYRFRFVAQSTGGGPVYGIDPDGGGPEEASFQAGLGGTFTTYGVAGPESCANDAFRTGVSASLPDCRAYEMVSPIDKEGGDIVALLETKGNQAAVLDQSSTSGSRLAYGSYRSFAGAESAPYTTQYVASRRDGVGWVTHAVSAPRGAQIYKGALGQADTELRAFSPDLCRAWFQNFNEPPLAAGAPVGVSDLYRRNDEECGGKTYEALNTTLPPSEEGATFALELQGFSTDGEMAVFMANDALATGGEEATFQLYGAREGQERFLCVLPGGGDYSGPCLAGGTTKPFVLGRETREGNVTGAVSADGSRVFWTALKEVGGHVDRTGGGPGKIYVRENPFVEGPECVEASSPCTVAVSQGAEELEGKEGSQFLAAAKDGSRALFMTNGALYEYRLGDESTHRIAGGFDGFMGASEDATRFFFGSSEVLSGPNAEGKSAVAGRINLYFHGAEGEERFVGTVGSPGSPPGLLSAQPGGHVARVSPDGLHAVFESNVVLTGYDNTDLVSGRADAEVFLYDAQGNEDKGKLVCVSCNPSGALPRGPGGEENVNNIPVFENILYASRVLADNGKRVFFDSYDALVPRDTNGREDVYEWEAPGEGGCTTASSGYSPQDGGCVDLISSGESKFDSEFIDASPSGRDVFFATLSSLVPQDPGLIDIYDAREDGGFPQPIHAAVCEGEACQPPAVAPIDATPASLTFSGPGDRSEPVGEAKPRAKSLTPTQQLAKALRACQKKAKGKRVACRVRARRRYRAKNARNADRRGGVR